jgi:M3 family oligoendopeptidase
MVARFRQQIEAFIVPIASRLYEQQRKRLGLDDLKYYDEDYKFPSGNPKPKGSPDDILRGADQMYAELSAETNRFFQFLRQKDLMDLEAKDGKATGGYCTYIPKYKAPYIFSNFNGTSGDIDVLTHEAGHAFQVYSSRNVGINEYQWPTYEACEIHSMSMEFFTWPWMQLFFKEDTDKYHFAHLAGALQFLPYGVAVDEFQHFVYEHICRIAAMTIILFSKTAASGRSKAIYFPLLFTTLTTRWRKYALSSFGKKTAKTTGRLGQITSGFAKPAANIRF